MRAGRAAGRIERTVVAQWIVTHVFCVHAPRCDMGFVVRTLDVVKLVRNRSGAMRRCGWSRKNTAVADHLTRKHNSIRRICTWDDVRESSLQIIERRDESAEIQTVVVYGWRWRLTGDLRDVIAKARMGCCVIILYQLA